MDLMTSYKEGQQLSSFIPSPSEGDGIIAKLGKKFQGGTILLDDGDIWLYLMWYLIAVAFFALMTVFWWNLFERIELEQFVKRTHQDKVYFIMLYVNIIHHIFVSCYASYLLYYSCWNDDGEPYPSQDGGMMGQSGQHFGWFRNEVCMMQYNKGYSINVLVSIAYMTVDLFILKVRIENPSLLCKQTIWHHIIAITGFSMTLAAGYGFPGLANASLLCEFSNIFLCFKDMFTKETRNTFWGIIAQLGFFLTFTIFRFILFPFLAYRTITFTILVWSHVGWFRKFALIFCTIQALLVLFLNLYWYMLILKGLKRLLEVVGVLKKKPGDTSYDEVEKYEASAHTELIQKPQENKNHSIQ